MPEPATHPYTTPQIDLESQAATQAPAHADPGDHLVGTEIAQEVIPIDLIAPAFMGEQDNEVDQIPLLKPLRGIGGILQPED